MILICRADQGEITFVRDGENDAPILALKKVTLVVVKQPAGHDMTAPHQPDAPARIASLSDVDVFYTDKALPNSLTKKCSEWRTQLKLCA